MLAHDLEEGGSKSGGDPYQWVAPSDHRVAEIRLLHEVSTVGEIDAESEQLGNLLITGDALLALNSLAHLPSIAPQLVGKVKMCYIDPPFNTEKAFEHYDDNLDHSIWLTMMRDRLFQIRTLLAANGSVWVHVDDYEAHRVRCVLDEVFGEDNFIGHIIWMRNPTGSMDATSIRTQHDHILVYGNTNKSQLNGIPVKVEDKYMRDESGRPYYWRELQKTGHGKRKEDRPNLYYPLKSPDGQIVFPVLSNDEDGRWRQSREKVEQNLEDIKWDRIGDRWVPKIKSYKQTTRPAPSIWFGKEIGINKTGKDESKKLFDGEPFDTPKPESLLERIIHMGSNPGDIVLDCFAGSGTTAAVAHKMGRRWVTIERSKQNVKNFALPRLTKVVNGEDPNGISDQYQWEGGGGFTHYEVGPSMFQRDFTGQVNLANWVTNQHLAEAVAAQLQFTFEPDPPFHGSIGKDRLVVIDGMVSTDVIEELAGYLDDDTSITIAATAIDPEARVLLRSYSKGSEILKIPGDILEGYGTRPVQIGLFDG